MAASSLNTAAESGDVDRVRELVEHGNFGVNSTDSIGRTPLHIACLKGHLGMVRILISEFMADMNIQDTVEGSTALMLAALSGSIDVVHALLCEYRCPLNTRDGKKWTVLHYACAGGNVGLVETLIREHKTEINPFDNQNSTPLHVAAYSGKAEVVLYLINHPDCNINARDSNGKYLLHNACAGGNVSLVQTLVREHSPMQDAHYAKVDTRDYQYNTPLHVAAYNGKAEVAFCLIDEFGCDPSVIGSSGKSLLHAACTGGNVSLVQTLIHKHKADVDARDDERNMPVHVAAYSGRTEVVLCLINDFGCDPNVKGHEDKSLLHSAFAGGNVSLVETLIRKHRADVDARDLKNNTPLHDAIYRGKGEVILCLIDDFGCGPSVRDSICQSLLYSACIGGEVGLVETLIHEHQADFNACDDQNSTPLHVAAYNGNVEVALCLINKFGCDANIKGYVSQSLLHSACIGGNVSLAQTLIRKHKADIYARDDQNNMPLHVAAYSGKVEMVSSLIEDFGCDPSVRGGEGRSLLHQACLNAEVLKYLLNSMSPFLVDKNGDTPLHYCAMEGNVKCVKVLLSGNPPILIRNGGAKTPADVATGEAKLILDQYLKDNYKKLQFAYNKLLKYAMKRYSGEHHLVRLFVVGNPGAGKSSLVESLRREGILKSFQRVSESSVPRHTAGIIPSTYYSKRYGRVLLYDFAGDREYYSSHAAILETLASSSKGDNIFLIVVNLQDDSNDISDTLHYWVSFIRQQKFTNPSLGIVGSHYDLIFKESVTGMVLRSIEQFLENSSTDFSKVGNGYFTSDCCNPRSRGIDSLQTQLLLHTRESIRYKMSEEASVLLGLLEKDFSEVVACTIQTIASHIKDSGVCLPDDVSTLRPIIYQLHEIGVLLLLEGTENGHYVVLNSSKLTNEVHHLLFSEAAITRRENRREKTQNHPMDIGVIPESELHALLPDYIKKECLLSLQYCQEIKHDDVVAFPSLDAGTCLTGESFLFFPALCSSDESAESWDADPVFSYGIGWLARYTASHEYLPQRFLHVLLLRLVFKFTLSAPTEVASPDSMYFQRRCTMWKTGVQWAMQNGVKCRVEIVNGSKGVLVLIKSIEDNTENTNSVFRQVICCVMEAKEEFCHSTPQLFLVDTTSGCDYTSDDNLFAMSDVKKVLKESEGIKMIYSISGKRHMAFSKLLCMCKPTHWESLFPITLDSVLDYLKNVHIDRLRTFGVSLSVPGGAIEEIEASFPRDVYKMKIEVLKRWFMSFPCWWHLVEALKDAEKTTMAVKITSEHTVDVELQQKLLEQDATKNTLKPDTTFLASFAGVVGREWPSLATSLSLSEGEIKEVREERGSPQESALLMLEKWVSSNDGASYSQLCHTLKTVSLF